MKRAVITVPAYFSDAQRNATREAGQLAGLDVVRILNEPTAAGLAYGYGHEEKRTVMIYDLGGGTFDVSIVTIEREVTEVLASHGNNHLGGDDFDNLLVDHLLNEFNDKHNIDLGVGYPAAYSRIWLAAEEAKKKLSFEPFAVIREESLLTVGGKPLHLETEISREMHEEMIRTLVESTLESVAKAMDDAGKKPGDLDAILMVGGSTRIPLVQRVLEKRAGITPRHDIHPDLCVALGAGVLASRLSGREVNRVLVDVSPYAFGPSYMGERGGIPYPYCYHPIIPSNTALPVTRTEKYYTSAPYQTEVQIDIYQGEDPDALKNIPVGHFHVKGLMPTEEPNMVLCRMNLDLDGILKVTAIEKATGKSKQIVIDNALRPKSPKEIAAAKKRLQDLFAARLSDIDDRLNDPGEADTEDEEEYQGIFEITIDPGKGVKGDTSVSGSAGVEDEKPESDRAWVKAGSDAKKLVERSRRLLAEMHDEDKEEAIELHERIDSAMALRDAGALSEACDSLGELLFFVEDK